MSLIVSEKGLIMNVTIVNTVVNELGKIIHCKMLAVSGNWYRPAVLRPLTYGIIRGSTFIDGIISGDSAIELPEDLCGSYRDPHNGEEIMKVTVFAKDATKVELKGGMPYVTIENRSGEWYVNDKKCTCLVR